MKDTKKVLSVQDISCLGQCSNTVLLPLLSAAGLETVVLPTALLSTHTGAGFGACTFLDLTGEMEKILAHYTALGVRFDLLATGYLGSPRQVELVRRMTPPLLKPGALRVIDPVLGDEGELYAIYTDAFVVAMRSLCAEADIITPNLTEACLLTGMPYRGAGYDKQAMGELIARLHALGPRTVVLTGVRFDSESIGVLGHTDGGEEFEARAPYIDHRFHGTGDTFAGAFIGHLARGHSTADAAARAVRFVSDCIADTLPMIDRHWYGLSFEGRLRDLID